MPGLDLFLDERLDLQSPLFSVLVKIFFSVLYAMLQFVL